MDDFYELSNHDEVERRFAAMVATLPNEGALWRSGVLDAEVVDLLQSSSQGDRRLDLLPPAAIPAAVLNACLDASWWEHGDRARLFKAAVRHALRLAPALTLRFTSRAMNGDLATIAPVPTHTPSCSSPTPTSRSGSSPASRSPTAASTSSPTTADPGSTPPGPPSPGCAPRSTANPDRSGGGAGRPASNPTVTSRGRPPDDGR